MIAKRGKWFMKAKHVSKEAWIMMIPSRNLV